MGLIREKVGYQDFHWSGKGPRNPPRNREKTYGKKSTARLLRRGAKRDPENAPGRVRDVTRGWYT